MCLEPRVTVLREDNQGTYCKCFHSLACESLKFSIMDYYDGCSASENILHEDQHHFRDKAIKGS